MPLEIPAVFAWPPRPLAAIEWTLRMILYPWVLLYLIMSIVIWKWLLPSEATMSSLELGWIAGIWLRNLVIVALIAGGLYWWLYVRRAQGDDFKFNPRWPGTGSKFTFGSQVRDNTFWTMTSGVAFLTAYESLTHWAYSSGLVHRPEWSSNPVVVVLMATLGVVFVLSLIHI